MDAVVIVLATLFLVLPMAAALARGVGGLSDLPASIWPALGRSLMVAVLATALIRDMRPGSGLGSRTVA
jgi:thiamine transport system permease protein